MKIISKIIYVILGVILFLGGGIALFNSTMAIPNIEDFEIASNESVLQLVDGFAHILKETGAAVIAIAALHFFGLFKFEKMTEINIILLLFWVIMAGIHWYEFILGNRTITSPLINSIPAILIIIVILFRKKIKAL